MEVQALIIFCMEMAGTVAFAASGAMTGISRRMDVFGVCVLGVVTAVGGGMMRDVILGNVPGALTKPVYVVAAVITALLIFAVLYLKRDMLQGRFGLLYDRMMLVMDSVGLGIFTVVGVITGIRNGYLENTFLLTFLGTLTGVGGGLLRDVIAQEKPYILTGDSDRYRRSLSRRFLLWQSGFWRHTIAGICPMWRGRKSREDGYMVL